MGSTAASVAAGIEWHNWSNTPVHRSSWLYPTASWERRLSRGVDREFDEFFLANYDRLLRSLTAITGQRETAQDCVQEAFIKAYARWPRLRTYDDPMLWVRKVAINRSRDAARSNARRKRREERYDAEPSRPTAGADVEGNMSLVEALEVLSPRQKMVAVLFYVDDMAVADIAKSLGLSKGAVKFHLNKARAALRETMSEEGDRV